MIGRKAILRAGVLLAALALSALIAEFILRAQYGMPFLVPCRSIRFINDAWTGYRLAPSQDIMTYAASGVAWFRTDRFGLVGPDHDPASTKRRIWLIGDSFMQAEQVNWSRHVARVLEELLKDSDILCAGAGGWTPEQEAQFVMHPPDSALFERTDEIVLAIFLGNDIEFLGDTAEKGRPVAEISDSGLVWRNVPLAVAPVAPKWESPLLLTKALALHSRNLGQRFDEWRAPASVAETGVTEAHLVSPLRRLMQVYRVEPHPRIERCWGICEALLAELRAHCAARGIRLRVMIIPERRQVIPEIWRLTMSALAEPEAVYDSGLPARRLREICGRHNIPVLDLGEYFAGHPEFFLEYDGHFSEAGHRRAAELLTR